MIDAPARAAVRGWRRVRLATRRGARIAKDEAGTSLTEFSFAFVVYVMVTLGVIQVAIWAFSAAAAQFAVWEGCRAGAAAYQPPPPDGRSTGSLRDTHELSDEYAFRATWAATTRTEAVLNWLPITASYKDLSAAIEEKDVAPGEEGQRQIVTSVEVEPFVFVPFFETLLATDGQGNRMGLERSCRLRLARFYSF